MARWRSPTICAATTAWIPGFRPMTDQRFAHPHPNKITLIGAIFLAAVAVLIIRSLTGMSIQLGGTSR